MSTLTTVMEHIRAQVVAQSEAGALPGYLAGVYHNGEQAIMAHGTANAATGMPMRENTGFLIGSITKIPTTTLVLQQVERGTLDLDERVISYLPEFRLADEGVAEQVRVRDLLTHTNGIDADLFFVDANGPDALRTYVRRLGEQCGSLFTPGERVSYSNGGMILAGRLLEVVTGVGYPELLARELYGPAGMADSSTSAKAAILRSTAVGHFMNPDGSGFRTTDMFMLPDSWGPAGGTPIGTIADLLAFGRTHLNGGISPTGTRVLSAEWTARMQEVHAGGGSVAGSPVGLGWLLLPMGDATVVTMSGASPGGVSLLVLVPEHDFAFAAFGNTPGTFPVHDELFLWLLREYLGVEVPRLVPGPKPGPVDLAPYAGRFRSDQSRVDVVAVDGELEETFTYEPQDEEQRDVFAGFVGGSTEAPPQRYTPLGDGLFAPSGIPLEAFDGFLRQLLVSYDGVDADNGVARYRTAGGRVTRRSES